jgi:hypothetical protein
MDTVKAVIVVRAKTHLRTKNFFILISPFLSFYLHQIMTLIDISQDLFAGSNDTSATTLQWAMGHGRADEESCRHVEVAGRGARSFRGGDEGKRGGPRGVELLAYGHQRNFAAASSIAAAVAQRVPRTVSNPPAGTK